MQANLQHCRKHLRQYDYPRYLLSLTLPLKQREQLWVLGAFNAEMARAAEASDPTAGAIRLKWWIDALQNKQRHPVVEALHELNVDLQVLQTAIEAREADLIEGFMFADMKEMDAYAIAIGGFWAVMSDNAEQEKWLRALGQAWVLQELLWSAGYHLSQGRCSLPEAVVAAHGINPLDMKSDATHELCHIIESLAKRVEETLKRLQVPQNAPLSRAVPFIKWRAQKMQHNPQQVLALNLRESRLKMLWKLLFFVGNS